MALIRQLLLTVLLLAGAAALWIKFDPAPGQAILNSGLDLPPPVIQLVAWLSPPAEDVADGASRSPMGGFGRGGGPTLVVVDEVTTSTVRDTMRAIGTAEAARSVAVYPDASGIVADVAFASGQQVAAGDVLVTLQYATEALALDRARITVAAAEEQLVRSEQLAASRAISAVEVETTARALDNARLDMRAAEIAFNDRAIIAPIDGRVGIVSVDVGDLVSNQTLIATIDDRSSLKIVFYVSETFVPSLVIGQRVEAVSTARPGEVREGVISAIDSRLDEASRTLAVEATIDNADDQLRPGMSFSIGLDFEGEEFLALDPLAIQWERAGAYAWKIEGGLAAKATLRIVQRDVERVLVASDALAPGDAVVTEGVQSVREGAEVRIEAPEPAAVADQRPDGPDAAADASGLGLATPASARETRAGLPDRGPAVQ